jgi:cytochrome P450
MEYAILPSLFGAWLVYTVFLVFYRLFLSPVAKFPGPRLAAATYWVEFYYDIVLGGKYIWKVKEWHQQYGPIIRINPDQLHVADPKFWDIMYTASTNSNRRDKWDWEAYAIGLPQSTLCTSDHTLHRHRRGALAPFFSMGNVRNLLPLVQERVSALVQRIQKHGKQNEVITMEHAFSAFSNDVVMQYSFGQHDNHIEAPSFDPSFHNTSFNAAKSISLLRHFPWILTTMIALPESLAVKMGEEVSSNVKLRSVR